MNTNLQSEKYGELLQAIAQAMATKNIEIDTLHEEITRLKQLLNEAERKELNYGKQKRS